MSIAELHFYSANEGDLLPNKAVSEPSEKPTQNKKRRILALYIF